MKNKHKYKICLALLIVAVIAAVVPVVWNKIRKSPEIAKDPAEMEAQEIRKYFESKEFTQLPIAEKVKFVESIPAGQRRALMRPVPPKNGERPQRPNQKMMQQMRKIMEYQMEQRLNKFFAASEAEQNRMLDEDIARMKQMRANMEKRRAQRMNNRNNNANNSTNSNLDGNTANSPERPQRPQMDDQARRDFEASMNPASRAKMRIYFEKLRQREQQKQVKQ